MSNPPPKDDSYDGEITGQRLGTDTKMANFANITSEVSGKKLTGTLCEGNMEVEGNFFNLTQSVPGSVNSKTTGVVVDGTFTGNNVVCVTGNFSGADIQKLTNQLSFGMMPHITRPKVHALDTSRGSSPSPDQDLQKLSVLLKKKLQSYDSHDLGLLEFLRPNMVKLCSKTLRLESFMRRLRELNVLTEEDEERINNTKATTISRCEEVYQMIAKQEAIDEMIEALMKSNNERVIELLRSWV